MKNPQLLWGKSAQEIAQIFAQDGYKVIVRQSNQGSQKATIIEIKGHPQIGQIQVHPGGGRHQGAYVKVSTATRGILKVVDMETYKPTPGSPERNTTFFSYDDAIICD